MRLRKGSCLFIPLSDVAYLSSCLAQQCKSANAEWRPWISETNLMLSWIPNFDASVYSGSRIGTHAECSLHLQVPAPLHLSVPPCFSTPWSYPQILMFARRPI